MMPHFSLHSAYRAAQRNLSVEDVDYVLYFGQCYHVEGALVYFLREKDLPAGDRANSRLARLAGTAVVLTKDRNEIITTWRNRERGLKLIARKSPRPARGDRHEWTARA